MTNEEAKEVIYEMICLGLLTPKEDEALHIAYQAIEKQISKKPMLTFKSNEYLTVRSHCCPVCRSSIIEGQKFCDECGHKLDWGSVNDTIFM